MESRFLSDEEKNIIKEMFSNSYTKDIAIKLNRSYSSISNFAHYNGLKKSKEFKQIELQKQGERIKEAGNKYRFKKGTTPPNKGQKMSKELYDKCKQTMFKKGIVPANWKPDGSERIDTDGYTMIKVNGKFELKHKHIWEQVNGKLPKGHAIIFKDGNKNNITIENLDCITRIELMKRNTIQRYPLELINTIKTLSKLKKQLNAKEQN